MKKGLEQKSEQQTGERTYDGELTSDQLERVAGGWPHWIHITSGRMSLGCAPTDEEMGIDPGSIQNR